MFVILEIHKIDKNKCMKSLGAIPVIDCLKGTEWYEACGCAKCMSHGVDIHTGEWYSYIDGKKVILETHFGRMLDSGRRAELDRIRRGEPLTEDQKLTKWLRLKRDLVYCEYQLENIPKIINDLNRQVNKIRGQIQELDKT